MKAQRLALRRGLEAIAFRQAGYFSAAQALTIGYTYQAQKYHVDIGNWARIDRGLFRLPHWPSSDDDQNVRWVLWSGGRGVLSHESALRIHDLSDVDPARVHLTVPPGARAEDPLVVLHHAALEEADVEERSGWKVTTPMRTLVDAAGSALSQEQVDRAIADALDRGLITRRSTLRATADLEARAALRLERALGRYEDQR